MIPRFKKSRFEPKPIETDYWIDLNENEYGGIFKYYDNNAMVWKQTESITREREPQFTNSPAYNITNTDIDNWNSKVGIEDFDALKEELLDLGNQNEGISLETLQYYNDVLNADINKKADKTSVYTIEQVDKKIKDAKVDLPENISYFKNDVGYVTEENLEDKLPDNIVSDSNYVHTDNNYTSDDKNKLNDLQNYDDSEIRTLINQNVERINNLQTNVEEDISEAINDMSNIISTKANLDEVYTRSYLDELFKSFVKRSHKTYGFVDDRPTNELTVEDTGFVFYDYTVNEPLIWVASQWRLLRTNQEFSGYLLEDQIDIPTSSVGNWQSESINEFTRLVKYTGDYISTLNIEVPNMYNNSFVLELGNKNDERLKPAVTHKLPETNITLATLKSGEKYIVKFSFLNAKPEAVLSYPDDTHTNVYDDFYLYNVLDSVVAETDKEQQDQVYKFLETADYINDITLPIGIKNINDGAFSCIKTSTDKHLSIPTGVATIGIGCFNNSSISSISFPKNPLIIKERAFEKNPLQYIDFPSTLDYDYVANGGSARIFSYGTNSNGVEVNMPEGVTAIPRGTFYNTIVKSINFPNSLKFIGNSAFYNSKVSGTFDSTGINDIQTWAFRDNKFEQIILRNDVEYLAPFAFYTSSSCKQFVMSPNLKHLSFGSLPMQLVNCSADIVTPPKLKELPYCSFYQYGYNTNGYAGVTPLFDLNLTLTEGLEFIGPQCFYYSNFTNDLVLPESLKYISSGSFGKMYKQKITKLHIGKNVRVIGGNMGYIGTGSNEIREWAIENNQMDKFFPTSKNGYSLIFEPYQYYEDGGKVYENSFEMFYHLATQTLKEYEVDEENKWFKSVDGVLFSKDGKRLVAYPPAKGLSKYEIPEGCVYCDHATFYTTSADPYYLELAPSDINQMYHGEGMLEEIVIPDTFINYTPEQMRDLFGPAACNMTENLLVVAINYFSGVKKVSCKETHPLYKNDGDWLLSKDGTELQCVLLGMHGDLRIPDSVTTIPHGAFCAQTAGSIPTYQDYSKLDPTSSTYRTGVARMHNNFNLIIPPSVVNIPDSILFTLNIYSNFVAAKTTVTLEEGNPAFVQDPVTRLISRRS